MSPESKAAVAARLDVTAGTDAAGRVEIDEFLHDAIAKAETCDSIPPSQRASIVARLRDAVGHLKVDRATLAAWRGALIRAWERVGRAATASLLAATMAAGVGGCGGGDTSPVPEPTVSASVAPEVLPYARDAFPKLGVPRDVADYFGSVDAAEDAYSKAAKAYVENLMVPAALTVDRADAKPSMFKIRRTLTADARRTFDTALARAAEGDEQAYRDAGALSLYAAGLPTDVTFTAGVPSTSVQKRVEKPRIAMASDGRAKISFEARGAMRITEDGERVVSPYAISTTLWLDRDGQISGWSGDWTAVDAGEQVPDRW